MLLRHAETEMLKTTFHFTEQQNVEFRRLADEQGRPFSQVVRSALDEWLLARKEGKTIVKTISKQESETGVTVWRREDGVGSMEMHYEGATASEENGMLVVQKDGKVLARLNLDALDGWTIWTP
jgi:hypothetical protein